MTRLQLLGARAWTTIVGQVPGIIIGFAIGCAFTGVEVGMGLLH